MRLLCSVTFQPPSLMFHDISFGLPGTLRVSLHRLAHSTMAHPNATADHQKLQLVVMQPQLAVSWHSQKINSSTGRGKGCGPKGGRTFFSGFANQFFCNKTLEPQQKLNGEVGFVKKQHHQIGVVEKTSLKRHFHKMAITLTEKMLEKKHTHRKTTS